MAEGVAERTAEWVAPYRGLLRSGVGAQLSYRASFALDLLGSAMIGLSELVEIYVIFHNVRALGGLDLSAALVVFGLSSLGFALADLLAGNLDQVPELIRSGRLDVLMLRPLPVLAQLVTGDVTLRRLGRVALSATVLGYALLHARIAWTPARLALAVTTPLTSAVLFAGLFVAAGAIQFWLIGAAEMTNAFVYGGNYASSFSAALMPVPLRLLFSFVVPASFVAYLPTLALFGLPGPAWLPAWLGWAGPVAAAATWLAALALWRSGIRHYTGAGG